MQGNTPHGFGLGGSEVKGRPILAEVLRTPPIYEALCERSNQLAAEAAVPAEN